jgi:serine/threonine-protein kinase
MSESIRPRPRAEVLVGAPSTHASGDAMPSEAFVETGRRRLAAAVAVVITAFTLYNVLYATIWSGDNDPLPYAVTMAELAACLACLVALFAAPPTSGRIARIGFVFHASLALAFATIEASEAAAGTDVPVNLISWNCANILLVPILLPTRARTVLAITAGLAAATPLTLLTVPHLFGTPEPTASTILSMSMPPFVCAAIAYFPSTVIEGLHREIAKARRLGAYDLVERIGEGGMGEVWRATHRLLARPAAIKLVRTDVLAEAGDRRSVALARFEREAKVTAALESPHTVELYDFGVSDDGTLYYVMELLCGLDLATLVERFGPLPPERVVYLLEQVCDSLGEAHRAGLIHRDVKPANIFVSRRAEHYDWVKVLDFGLVRPRDVATLDESKVAVTGKGQIPGTPAFLAPESAVGEGELDGRADLYSLGCVAYFALTGGFVFESDSPMGMAVAHVTATPQAPSERLGSPLPKELDEVVLACLAKAPAERPASAKELAARLRAIRFETPWDVERAAAFWREHLSEHFHA